MEGTGNVNSLSLHHRNRSNSETQNCRLVPTVTIRKCHLWTVGENEGSMNPISQQAPATVEQTEGFMPISQQENRSLLSDAPQPTVSIPNPVSQQDLSHPSEPANLQMRYGSPLRIRPIRWGKVNERCGGRGDAVLRARGLFNKSSTSGYLPNYSFFSTRRCVNRCLIPWLAICLSPPREPSQQLVASLVKQTTEQWNKGTKEEINNEHVNNRRLHNILLTQMPV